MFIAREGCFRRIAEILKNMLICFAWISLAYAPPPANQTCAVTNEHTVASDAGQTNAFPVKLGLRHVANAIRVHQKVVCGGQPEGELAFQELGKLGIKTILSVDGARPDVGLARKYDMRYAHLPHSYQGISQQQVKQLAKAVRDLEGPIFIHCHHGKHRSPTAAVVASISAGLLKPSEALPILRLAGTSTAYQGLYAAAQGARPLDLKTLAAVPLSFPEVAELPVMAEAMVNLEHVFDRLKRYNDQGWSNNLRCSVHDALLLKEHFTELRRHDSLAKESPEFNQLITESEHDANELYLSLQKWVHSGARLPATTAMAHAFERISKTCTDCHRQFRDIPTLK